MRYVGRHRAPRPLLLRRPIIGGVAGIALLSVPAVWTAELNHPVHVAPSSASAGDKSAAVTPAPAATGLITGGATIVPTDSSGNTVATSGPARVSATGGPIVVYTTGAPGSPLVPPTTGGGVLKTTPPAKPTTPKKNPPKPPKTPKPPTKPPVSPTPPPVSPTPPALPTPTVSPTPPPADGGGGGDGVASATSVITATPVD